MRMSCNGCRILRKGCSDACTIRPCLQWIKSPEAQANATVFLAKFYGRAGLLNLLAAPAPPAAQADHLRPAAVFRSLLYEACGRIVNPVYGSVGLLWSGQWQACQAAVEAVLKGDPVVQVDATSEAPPLLGGRRYDIRHVHVARDPDADAAADLLRVARGGRRGRKRAAESSTSSKPSGNKRRASPGNNNNDPLRRRPQEEPEEEPEPVPLVVEHDHEHGHDEESAGSHDHQQQGSEDTDVEAASHSHVSQAEPDTEPQSHAPPPPPASNQQQANQDQDDEEEEVGLELTLGLDPLVRQRQQRKSSRCDHSGLSAASSLVCLRLQLPA